jgi:hypothetical protein
MGHFMDTILTAIPMHGGEVEFTKMKSLFDREEIPDP